MNLQPLLERFRQGDRRALSRLLTMVGHGQNVAPVASLLRKEKDKQSRVVAVTGSAGVGKSTLIGKLIELLRSKGQTVAVLACDPQSPLTGGALLGDRFRMPNRPDDSGVFIRSLATAGGWATHGAVAERTDRMIEVLKAFGFDWILLETVGAGQGDTAVRELAELVVLLLQPEAGDDIQWEKAGLLEVADLVVIHKADLPGAERVEAQVRGLLNLPGCREVPVLAVSSGKGKGLEELLRMVDDVLERKWAGAKASDQDASADHLGKLVRRELDDRLHGRVDLMERVADRWKRRELDDRQAVEEVLRGLAEAPPNEPPLG